MQTARLLSRQRAQLATCQTRARSIVSSAFLFASDPPGPAVPPANSGAAYVQEEAILKRELPESPESFVDDGQGIGNLTEEELAQRKTAAVRAWMEAQVGAEKVAVAQILKDHNVLVRGGPEQGTKLMDALVAWKQGQSPA